MTPIAQATPPVSQPVTTPMTTPISADMMSPSGVRISLGGPRAERRNSHTGQPPLDDQSECVYSTVYMYCTCIPYVSVGMHMY